MVSFNTWRSLVDGESISAIPDSVEYRFDARTITVNDGEEVASWDDQVTGESITGNSGSVPLYRESVSALDDNPAVEWVDDGDQLKNTSFDNIPVPHSRIAIIEVTDESARHHIDGDFSQPPNYAMEWNDEPEWRANRDGDTIATGSTSNPALVSIREEDSGATMRVNRTEVGSTSDGPEPDFNSIEFPPDGVLNGRDPKIKMVMWEIHSDVSEDELIGRENDLVDEFGLNFA